MSEALKNNVEVLQDWRKLDWKERTDAAPKVVADELEQRLSDIENLSDADKAAVLREMLAEYQEDIDTNYYLAKQTAELLHSLVGNPAEQYRSTLTAANDNERPGKNVEIAA
jgi:predicted DNA-binding protein